MIFKIILILAICTQFMAGGIAISLIRKTKYNASWMLLTAGFIIQAIRLVIEYLPIAGISKIEDTEEFMAWSAIFMALFFVAGVFFIQKIFKYMQRMEAIRRNNEKILLNAIIQAEERERRRFAKDLHDGLGPLLSTVKMSMSSLTKLDYDEHSKEIVSNTEVVIDEAIKTIKEISNNLSPHVLDNFGLKRAIQNFIKKLNALQTIHIELVGNLDNNRFDKDKEVVLYRIICELINNTIKHAKAKNIKIDLNTNFKDLTLIYTDDGVGMDTNLLDQYLQSGMGISNIFSRLSSLKGEIDVYSKPKKGITINIKVGI